MRAVRFAEDHLDGCDCMKSVGHDPTKRIPLLLDYRRPIIIKVSTLHHVSTRDSPSVQLNHDYRISLMRSTVANYAHVLMAIKWTKVHKIDACRSAQFDPMHHELPRRLRNLREELVPHGGN